MLKSPQISVNQLAEYSSATDNQKNRIIQQQKVPPAILIAWYQLAKARIKKSISEKGNLNPVLDGLKILNERIIEKDSKGENRKKIDKQVSIEALERFLKLKLPQFIKDLDFKVINPPTKSFSFSEVEIRVAPDVIFRGSIKGQKFLGAIKLHVSKTKPFDYKKSSIVASSIYKFLNEEIANDDTFVDPTMCVCIDIFAETIITARQSTLDQDDIIVEICEDIKRRW